MNSTWSVRSGALLMKEILRVFAAMNSIWCSEQGRSGSRPLVCARAYGVSFVENTCSIMSLCVVLCCLGGGLGLCPGKKISKKLLMVIVVESSRLVIVL